MPNHATSICTITGPKESLQKFFDTHWVKGEEGAFLDFQTIIPMPAILNDIPSDSYVQLARYALTDGWLSLQQFGCVKHLLTGPGFKWCQRVLEWLENESPKSIDEAKRSLRAIAETGSPDWYDWKTKHWGTKWGAYACEIRSSSLTELVLKFDTAWCFPTPVFEKLAEMYPDLTFAVVSCVEHGEAAYTGEFNGKDDFDGVSRSSELFKSIFKDVYGMTEEEYNSDC